MNLLELRDSYLLLLFCVCSQCFVQRSRYRRISDRLSQCSYLLLKILKRPGFSLAICSRLFKNVEEIRIYRQRRHIKYPNSPVPHFLLRPFIIHTRDIRRPRKDLSEKEELRSTHIINGCLRLWHQAQYCSATSQPNWELSR